MGIILMIFPLHLFRFSLGKNWTLEISWHRLLVIFLWCHGSDDKMRRVGVTGWPGVKGWQGKTVGASRLQQGTLRIQGKGFRQGRFERPPVGKTGSVYLMGILALFWEWVYFNKSSPKDGYCWTKEKLLWLFDLRDPELKKRGNWGMVPAEQLQVINGDSGGSWSIPSGVILGLSLTCSYRSWWCTWYICILFCCICSVLHVVF